MTEYPAGALTSLEQIKALGKRVKSKEKIVLYTVTNKGAMYKAAMVGLNLNSPDLSDPYNYLTIEDLVMICHNDSRVGNHSWSLQARNIPPNPIRKHAMFIFDNFWYAHVYCMSLKVDA